MPQASAWWQSIQQVGVGGAVSYQGPGDVVSGATAFGSCARAYNLAYANGTNSLCDLVDSAAPSTPICTLRVKTNGFVDLTGAYCTGSVTPATKCAAATGAVCNVSKVYDQTGNGNHWTNTTAASQPVLQFSAINSLPGLKCTSAASSVLSTAGSFTATATGMSLSAVWERTSNFTARMSAIGFNSVNAQLGPSTGANSTDLFFGVTTVTKTSTADSAFHAGQGIFNGASSVLSVDGSSTSGTLSGSDTSGVSRLCRGSGGGSIDGIVMEGFFYISTVLNATQYGNINANQHSATSGYNF